MANEILDKVQNTTNELLQILQTLNEEKINEVPFENSWTAAQLTDHVTRSINGMGEAMNMPGKFSDRKPDAKANELQVAFLNFDNKMKSPPFILPTQDVYKKDLLLEKFKNAGIQFTSVSQQVNLSELIDLKPLGEYTKLEIIYFILYHTQRHIHQLKNILEKVNSKN